MKILSSLVLVGLLGYSSLIAADYNRDAAHSCVGGLKVKHMMISNVKGSFGSFAGTFILDEIPVLKNPQNKKH